MSAAWSLTERGEALRRAERNGVDLLIVGGGITGAGVLRDAASRGLRALLVERDELRSLQNELAAAQRRIASARRQRTRLLAEIREDRAKREEAVEELRAASRAMSDLVGSLQSGGGQPAMDMRKFKGLLDWPADGEVSSEFGTMVHPRFKTRVPHPGLDIEGEAGENIRCVFDRKNRPPCFNIIKILCWYPPLPCLCSRNHWHSHNNQSKNRHSQNQNSLIHYFTPFHIIDC